MQIIRDVPRDWQKSWCPWAPLLPTGYSIPPRLPGKLHPPQVRSQTRVPLLRYVPANNILYVFMKARILGLDWIRERTYTVGSDKSNGYTLEAGLESMMFPTMQAHF